MSTVGHVGRSLEATYLAAVLACGQGALLSGRAAAYIHALLKGSPPPPQVTGLGRRRVPGVRCREAPWVKDAGARVRGIPILTVPWTLVDVAGQLGEEALARAAHEAHVKYRVGAAQILRVLEVRPNAPGARKIRRVIQGDIKVSLSYLERVFLTLLRSEGLPLPETNIRVDGRYVDCRWPEFKLTVELDSFSAHATRYAWERDRIREREAYARGDQFRHYTYGDVVEYPAGMLRELRSLLLPSLL